VELTSSRKTGMRLAVCSHKPCWPSSASPSGYATDGGFAFQMDALSQLSGGPGALAVVGPTVKFL